MKKLFLSLAVAAMSATAFAGEVQEVLTVADFGLTKNSAYAEVSFTSTITGITYTGQMAMNNDSEIQLRSNNNNSGIVISANPKGAILKSVKIENASTTAARTVSVYGNTTAYTAPTDLYAAATQGTLIGEADVQSNGEVTAEAGTNYTFMGLRSKSASIYLKQIVITYEIAGMSGKKAAELEFNAVSLTAKMGASFTEPTLSKQTNADVTYSSSNEEVATVNSATGALTLVAPGTCVISAAAAENDEYYAGEASYKLTVLAANVVYFNTCQTADCGFASEYAEGSFNPWGIDATYGLKASAYASGATNASDAVMASPVFDLTGLTSAALSFEHALNQFKVNNEMLPNVSDALQYVSVVAREEGATEWTKLSSEMALPESFSWTYVNSGKLDLSAYVGKKMQIGFRYTSTTECAGTWEIKNVELTGEGSQGGVEAIETAADAPATYYNLQGVRVANPSNGLYIKVQGNKSTKVIVK